MGNKPIQLVVFDMAGTVVDEDNIVYKTLHKALIEGGYSVSLADVLRWGAGKEKRTALVDVIQEMNLDKTGKASIDDMFASFTSTLAQAYEVSQAKPMPGSEELISALRAHGVKVALNTGYKRKTAEKLVAQLTWESGREIDVLVASDDVKRGRPHPDMILRAMNQLNVVDPNAVVKVGDSKIDIQEGKNAGCGITVGVTTGAHTREQLAEAEPTFTVDHLSELINLMQLSTA